MKGTRIKRCIAFLVVLCLTVMYIPQGQKNVEVESAAYASVKVTSSISRSQMYPNQSATVQLQVTGKEGTIVSPTDEKIIPTDIVLVIDQSTSMLSKMSALKSAVVNFLNKINFSKHRVGIVGYSTNVVTTYDFSDNKQQLISKVNEIRAGGLTYIVPAINKAVSMLAQNKRSNAKPVVIVLTDGMAEDRDQAAAAAKAAKEQGVIFYTIGMYGKESNANVQGTTEYIVNKTLEDLATSAEHHHFIGVEKLDETLKITYEQIASTIGTDKAKNVKITQTLPEEFEYVAGSADKNVPRPTVSGKTITWEMQEVLNGSFKLSYKIKPKSGIAYGTYHNLESGSLTYELNDGTKKTETLNPGLITIKEPPKPVITDMTPKTGLVGEAKTVTVTASNMDYANGFRIEVGGKEVPLEFHCKTYFTFKVPTDLGEGSYSVIITNGGGIKETAGQYEYTKKPVPTMPPMDFTPKSGVVKKEKNITVSANNKKLNVKKENLEITVKDTTSGSEIKIAPEFCCNTYFTFKMPDTLTEGTYGITITNTKTGQSQDIGQYSCNPVPTPKPLPLDFLPKSGKEKTATTVTVNANGQKLNMKKADIKVQLVDSNSNSVNVPVDFACTTYFTFVVPTTLAAGSYDVIVFNKGVPQTLTSKYTCKAIPTPTPPILDFAPKSGKEKAVTTVTVSANGQKLNMKKEDIQVKLESGGKSVTVSADFACTTYFTFKVPATLVAGKYDVTVLHKGVEQKLTGQYSCKEVVAPTMPPMKLSPSTGTVGKKTTVTVKAKVDGQKINVKKENLQITLKKENDSVNVPSTFCCTTYLTFDTPTTLKRGAYDVYVKDKKSSQEVNVGVYTCR